MKLTTRLMNRILPTCEDVSHLTSQAMDESLPFSKRLGLRLHLMMCVWCRRNSEQLRLIRDLARRLAASEPDDAKLDDAARARLTKLLEQNDPQS
ncbi:MAG: hypothetical protein Kow0074_16800 [Candidatus Zixiibacteriota bacterium]